MLTCSECGEPVSANQAWYEIVGWEHPRKQGGTNAVKQRTRTGRVMCEADMLRKDMQRKTGPVGDRLF